MSRSSQFARAVRRNGASITLRTTSKGPPPAFLPNPATLILPVLDLTLPTAPRTLNLRAASAIGRLVAGDILGINGIAYTVTGDAPCRLGGGVTPGIPNVPIIPNLAPITGAGALLDGTPIAVSWSADVALRAMVNSFPNNLIDGTLIQANDLSMTIAARSLDPLALADEPALTDTIMFGDKLLTIVSVQAVRIRDEIVSYRIQAR